MMTWDKPHWKPSRTARKKAERRRKLDRVAHERDEKSEVRKRDKHCRFPLCGCRKLQLRTVAEVAHLQHKGMGGNPKGDRSTADGMIYFCVHRHQDGAVSLHKGTLKVVPLTREGTDGPVAFLVDKNAAGKSRGTSHARPWFEVARERARGELETLKPDQAALLLQLAEMDR